KQEVQQEAKDRNKLQADLAAYKNLVRDLPENKTLIGNIADAAKANSTDCANSVAAFADKVGIKALDGMRANDQIDYMTKNWKQLTPEEAQERANQGKPTFFGKTDQPNGHDGMVVPGWLDPRFQQPSMAGGAMHKDPVTGDITAGVAFNTD